MNDIKGIIEDCYKSDLVSDRVIKKVVEIIGQGEWQNLHDENSDICTTMGELIITLDGIADLEKENAELKKKNLATQDAVTMQMYTNKANKEIADRQLTKAKEIIKDFLLMAKVEHLKDRYETVDEAEQFLNSEVEK